MKKKAEVVSKKKENHNKKVKNTNENDNGKEKVGDAENEIERRTYFFAFHWKPHQNSCTSLSLKLNDEKEGEIHLKPIASLS